MNPADHWIEAVVYYHHEPLRQDLSDRPFFCRAIHWQRPLHDSIKEVKSHRPVLFQQLSSVMLNETTHLLILQQESIRGIMYHYNVSHQFHRINFTGITAPAATIQYYNSGLLKSAENYVQTMHRRADRHNGDQNATTRGLSYIFSTGQI